jgi:hypothetical protein
LRIFQAKLAIFKSISFTSPIQIKGRFHWMVSEEVMAVDAVWSLTFSVRLACWRGIVAEKGLWAKAWTHQLQSVQPYG